MTLLDLAQTPPPSVPADTTAWKAVETLKRSRSGAVIVTDAERVAGLVSEHDLVHRVVGEGRDPRKALVREVMTSDPVCAGPDSDLDDAFHLMVERRVRHLVVCDADRRPLGLLSLRVLAQERMEKAADTIGILQDYTNDALGG